MARVRQADFVHESGHVVAAVCSGFDVESVSVGQDAPGVQLGDRGATAIDCRLGHHISLCEVQPYSERLWLGTLRRLFVLYAGVAAHAVQLRCGMTKAFLDGGVSDHESAIGLLAPFTMDSATVAQIADSAMEKTLRMMRDKRCSGAVAKLANAIRAAGGHLDGRTAEGVVCEELGDLAFRVLPLIYIPMPAPARLRLAG